MILRLNKIFHPEILLDKRGETVDRRLYKHWMANCKIIDDKLEVTDRGMLRMIERDPHFGPNLGLWKKFIESKAKIFHFSKSLFETLLDVESKLPISALPEQFIGYLSFPDGMMVDADGVAYQGAYVWIDELVKMPLHPYGKKRGIMIHLVPEDFAKGDLCLRAPIPDQTTGDVSEIGADLAFTFSENWGEPKPSDGGQSWRHLELQVIKCVLFLTSDEPDLMGLKPLGGQSRTSAKKLKHNFCETSTVPITLVGWNWVRTPPEYRTGMWYRKAHFSTRWSGPSKSVLKPVFVKESWPKRRVGEEE